MNLFDQLIALGRAGDARPIETKKVPWICEINHAGQFRGFRRGPKEPREILKVARGSDVLPSTGPTDTATYVLGLGDKATPRVAAYYQLQREIHASLPEAVREGVAAVVAFSEGPIEQARAAATDLIKPLDWVHISVIGVPDWTTDPKVMAIHSRRLRAKQSGDARGECPFCGVEDAPLTRVYPPSGPATLCSFNAPAFEAYGRKQGLVAPMCVDCSSSMARGLSGLLTPDYQRSLGDLRLLWWDPRGETTPITAWDALWSRKGVPGAPPESLGDGTGSVLVLSQNKLRWSVRRHYSRVDHREIANRVRRWQATFGSHWTGFLVEALLGRPRSNSADTNWDTTSAAIHYHLIGGEPLPVQVFQQARSRLMSDVLDERNRRLLTALLSYQENPMRVEPGGVNLTGQERGHYLLGRALARAGAQQWRTSGQNQIRDTHATLARRATLVVVELIQRHCARDKIGSDYLREALAFGFAPRPSPTQSALFMVGYADQEAEARAAAKARKAAAAAETNE